jgi:AcrR family transcriptional regulator
MSLDMRSTLIDVATGQVRRLGYSAFSYADLAAAVGIRKPSIHHHFPAKEDLGVAIVAAYTEHFSEQLARIDAKTGDMIERLRAYARLYREGLEARRGCLCGVLATGPSQRPPVLRPAPALARTGPARRPLGRLAAGRRRAAARGENGPCGVSGRPFSRSVA